MKALITGGAGFIGSHLVETLLKSGMTVLNIDKMTYAANSKFIEGLASNKSFHHRKICLTEKKRVNEIALEFNPDYIFHLAAESHVDRSIDDADPFVESNVIGTVTILEASRKLYDKNKNLKMIHVSTDEVYGSLDFFDPPFTSQSQYLPNSPYSASKAASDHFARAWWKTYGCPVVITHCSNNYGPRQFTEKLIPVVISCLENGIPVPVYGTGRNVRDWLHVQDHVDGLVSILNHFSSGTVYNFGADNEVSNIDLVKKIISIYDSIDGRERNTSECINFVSDRLGHDLRYSIDSNLTKIELGWSPKINFTDGLTQTIKYYKGKRK